MKIADLKELEQGTILRYDNFYIVTNGDKIFTLLDGSVYLEAIDNFKKETKQKEIDFEIINPESLTGCFSRDEVLKRAKKSRILTNISWTCAKDWVDYLLYDKQNYLYKVYGRTFSTVKGQEDFSYEEENVGNVYREITATFEYDSDVNLLEKIFSKTRLPVPGDDIGFFMERDKNLKHTPVMPNTKLTTYIMTAPAIRALIDNDNGTMRKLFESFDDEYLCPTIPYLKHGIYAGENTVYSIEAESVEESKYRIKKETLEEFFTIYEEKSFFSSKRFLAERGFIFDHDYDSEDRAALLERLKNGDIENKLQKYCHELKEELTDPKIVKNEWITVSDYIYNALGRSIITIDNYNNNEDSGKKSAWQYWTNNLLDSCFVVEQSWRLRRVLDAYNKKFDVKLSIPQISKQLNQL